MSFNRLTPEGIYTIRAWEYHKKNKTTPYSFYQNQESKIRYDKLQNEKIPTETQIYKHQKKLMMEHFAPYKKKLDNLIEPINQDLQNGVLDYSIDIQQILKDLEIFFNSKQADNSIATLKNKISKNEVLLQDYQRCAQNARQLYKKLSNVSFLNSADFQKQIKNLKDFFEMIEYEIQINGIQNVSSDGILNKLSYFSAAIRGRALELAAQEEIKNRLDKMQVTNIQVLDTAKAMEVRIGVSGKAVTGKSRTGSVDTLINLQLQTANGKVLSLEEYIKLLEQEDNKEIAINQIVEKFQGVGIQAKASSKSKVKPFSGTRGIVSLADILNLRIKSAINLKLLTSLIKERYGMSVFYKTDKYNNNGPIYNPLFNYAIAKNLHHVVGEHNVLIATNNGIQYMDEYIFNNNYYIGVGGFVNIADINKKLYLSMKKLTN